MLTDLTPLALDGMTVSPTAPGVRSAVWTLALRLAIKSRRDRGRSDDPSVADLLDAMPDAALRVAAGLRGREMFRYEAGRFAAAGPLGSVALGSLPGDRTPAINVVIAGISAPGGQAATHFDHLMIWGQTGGLIQVAQTVPAPTPECMAPVVAALMQCDRGEGRSDPLTRMADAMRYSYPNAQVLVDLGAYRPAGGQLRVATPARTFTVAARRLTVLSSR
jgi:hypothetical protein